jgi:hypothetical protein
VGDTAAVGVHEPEIGLSFGVAVVEGAPPSITLARAMPVGSIYSIPPEVTVV